MRACIQRGLSPANGIRPHSSALVCGAGGMARAAVYSLISLGVRHIFVYNRTAANATALAEHYNKLGSEGQLTHFVKESTEFSHIRVLDTLSTSWPADKRHPTIIVNCIPRQSSDKTSINFTLPASWLNSPTGGVVVEVSPETAAMILSSTDKPTGCL